MKSISRSAGAQAKSKTPVASICSLLARWVAIDGGWWRKLFVCVWEQQCAPVVLSSRAFRRNLRCRTCSSPALRLLTISFACVFLFARPKPGANNNNNSAAPLWLEGEINFFAPDRYLGLGDFRGGLGRAFDTPVTRRVRLLFANFCPTRGLTQLLFSFVVLKGYLIQRSFYGALCVSRWIHPARMHSFEIPNLECAKKIYPPSIMSWHQIGALSSAFYICC